MQGKKIPQGTAVPEVMQVKKNQQTKNTAKVDGLKLLPPDIKVLIVDDY
jgi:hypothetical protein